MGKMELGKIKDGGGYDLSEIALAEESLSQESSVINNDFTPVDPIFIQVSDGEVFRTEEHTSRIVVIEYDELDNVVSVELL